MRACLVSKELVLVFCCSAFFPGNVQFNTTDVFCIVPFPIPVSDHPLVVRGGGETQWSIINSLMCFLWSQMLPGRQGKSQGPAPSSSSLRGTGILAWCHHFNPEDQKLEIFPRGLECKANTEPVIPKLEGVTVEACCITVKCFIPFVAAVSIEKHQNVSAEAVNAIYRIMGISDVLFSKED